MNKILVINGGSSSIKFRIFDDFFKSIASGICERIFVDGLFSMTYLDADSNEEKKIESKEDFENHDKAIECLLNKLIECKVINSLDEISGIGHRVVQGASDISESVIIDEAVENIIEKNIVLAPLHNKPELDIIKIMKAKLPNVQNVGVFDSAFHTTIPNLNSTYAVPKKWREEFKVKRYGAHGTSFRYITEKAQEILNKDKVNLIICHLGNGASVCAVKDSKSINTSMGITPLEGLIMGTRSGDVDPSIFNYISKLENLSAAEIDNILNKESGLKGLCGYSDFRDISSRAENDNEFQFTIDLFSKRVADYIVRYMNDLENKIDAIIFTGGIGENASVAREAILSKVNLSHVHLDKELNKNKYSEFMQINSSSCKFSKKIFVIRTNEELLIAKDVKNLIK